MAKTKVSEWDSNASGNTDINGININEGCPPSTLNNMGRELMAQLKNMITGADGDSMVVGGNLTVNGTTTLTGNATAPTQTSTDNSTKVATTAYVQAKVGTLGTMSTQNANAVSITGGAITTSGALAITGAMTVDGDSGTSGQFLTSAGTGNTPTWTTLTAFVSGMIMLWSGSEASIPSGWLLCDGNNSTPDLQDRFVVGAGNTYAVEATGGSADAVVVSHTHGAGTLVTAAAGSHNHYLSKGAAGQGGGNDGNQALVNPYSDNDFLTSTVAAHTHTISGSTAEYGENGINKNLPPYFALCYIMKT